MTTICDDYGYWKDFKPAKPDPVISSSSERSTGAHLMLQALLRIAWRLCPVWPHPLNDQDPESEIP